ncbi:MAG: hypothetical protein AUJ92_05780 [Armatimonadetes bacterium CG2_30_59_28]|nr:HD-GYP domain-containing protein [Armatimonadota bacterium]OIO96520.1 MAG: hypothetical protein AUJ92_05780 [Armatimonadetes bacterium CG2_30_59_28]PIU64315.1 MAG: hypothetical protein COS85_12960 [Armatimonadetes bacterium CG07_land_8_20_14_0_80_59_28]PIX40798.1 MAG: hypothetical protein COZ56_13755 [Armatimonadetes bacterium CG_4_8_14_3_um_filter_58_9]PIY40883.1 MAG: hypothetical protein COZ05_16595 [Armatimonadetes bacterium CG_4_10_14_3_um_filter_59_10]PJB66114.1 MAG: hypothetical prote
MDIQNLLTILKKQLSYEYENPNLEALWWDPEVTAPAASRDTERRMATLFITSVIVVTIAQYLLPDLQRLLVNLYFVPIVAAGYQWRARGAIAGTLIALACHGIVLFLNPEFQNQTPDEFFQVLAIRSVIFMFVGLVTAIASIEYSRLVHRIRRYETDTISALARAIDAKDHYTHDHSGNVSDYAVLIARQIGMTPEEIEVVRFKGLMHDVGKIGIEENILNKPGRLTNEEFTRMKQHVMIGVDILDRVDGLDLLLDGTHHHHERIDGTGYPSGLKEHELSLHDKILGIVDAYDAMTADRPYRKAMPQSDAVMELKRCAGLQFDRDLVYAFIDALDSAGKLEDPAMKAHGPSAVKAKSGA